MKRRRRSFMAFGVWLAVAGLCAPGSAFAAAGAAQEVLRLESEPLRLEKGATGEGAWDVVLDCGGHAPGLAVLVAASGPTGNRKTRAGDLLVDLRPSALLYVAFEEHLGDAASFRFPFPRDAASLGLQIDLQGLCLGAPRPALSNALHVRFTSEHGTSSPSNAVPTEPGVAEAAGAFAITGCSLGCFDPGTGQLQCAITDIHVNEEIRVEFSDAIALSSVDPNSFQVIEVATGQTPAGSFSIDANNDRILVYRPRLSFDSAGNPIFGLKANETYTLKIPGTSLDPLGPYVTSVSGAPNETRLQCTLVASQGVEDAVPGNPSVSVEVDVVTGYDPTTGLPNGFEFGVAANEADQVFLSTDVTFVFDDIMNPATLANPVTGMSTSLSVEATPADGDDVVLPVAGIFTITLDTITSTTRVVFRPDEDLRERAKIVVGIAPSIEDLAGNALDRSGTFAFLTEVRPTR